jgi:ferritin-like metal-binding protein YciE
LHFPALNRIPFHFKRHSACEEIAMQLSTLEDLLVDELKDLYSAENQLLKAIPKMAKAATSKGLRAGFEKHLKQTEGHVERLEQVCDDLGVSPKGKKCKAMEGLIEEGADIIEEDAEPEVKDAALIAAAQKVEHYEIAGYGCVRTYAELLGNTKAAKLLQQTLDEEGDTDKALTKLAESINVEAEAPDGEWNGKAAKKKAKRSMARA